MLRILVGQVGERIYSIARLRHGKLHIRCSKLIIVANRQLHHSQSIKLMNERLTSLQGILWTNHKPYLIQISAIQQGIRNDQMTYMDGIKGTEVESDFQNANWLKIH